MGIDSHGPEVAPLVKQESARVYSLQRTVRLGERPKGLFVIPAHNLGKTNLNISCIGQEYTQVSVVPGDQTVGMKQIEDLSLAWVVQPATKMLNIMDR